MVDGGVQIEVGKARKMLRSKRVRAMVAFLVQNEERLGNIPRGKVTLSFAGKNGLSVVIEEKIDL